jgi:signal transduction histidine kinase
MAFSARWIPSRLDLSVGVLVLGLSQLEVWRYGAGGGTLAAALTLGASGILLAWRNLQPVAVVVLVQACDALCDQLAQAPFSATSVVTAALSFFALGAMANRVASTITMAAFMVVAVAETQPLTLNNYLSIALSSVGVPWLLGLLWLRRRTRIDESDRQRLAATEAVAQERLRLARELHDVVSHNVGMIAVQAGAADLLLDGEPGGTRESLRAIESGARSTLLELRQLLGLLRDTDPDPVGRRTSISALDEIITPLSAAGVTVSVSRHGVARPLPREVDVTAYRVVQESLTNVVAHAGPCRVEVSVTYRPEHLVVEVTDDGVGTGSATAGSGYGLVGMRERIAALGGRFEAGRAGRAGFRVWAEIPAASQ